VDGVLEERHLGEHDHARLQLVLGAFFFRREREWNIHTLVEQRVQVRATRFRVPDVAVLDRDQPVEQILTHPPLIVMEVLSPEDTWARMEERIADYLDFGIPNLWVLEPGTRRAWTISPEGRALTSILKVAGTPIAVALEELFQEL
jgi:Uma2 family endonuclease